MLAKFDHLREKCFLVNFSETATQFATQYNSDQRVSIINADAVQSFDFIKTGSLNVVRLFCFLHELENSKELLGALMSRLYDNHLIVLSDNTLYASANHLQRDFLDCGFEGKCNK